MLLDAARARYVFSKVRELQEEIRASCLAADRPDLSVEDFQHILETIYGIAIEKRAVDVQAEFLAGMVERYQDRAVIYVKDGMGREWLRFVATKELCHLLGDIEDDCSTNGVDTIEYLLEEYKFSSDEDAERVAQSEVLAEVAAIELMYPYAERCADREKVASETLTTSEIAKFYAIPEFIVSRALADWFHRLSSQVWELVDSELQPTG